MEPEFLAGLSVSVVGGAGGGGAGCVPGALWAWAAPLNGHIVWPGAPRCGGSGTPPTGTGS